MLAPQNILPTAEHYRRPLLNSPFYEASRPWIQPPMRMAGQPQPRYHSPMIDIDRLTPFIPTAADRSNPESTGLFGQNTRGTGRTAA